MIKVTPKLLKELKQWLREGHSIYYSLKGFAMFSENLGLLSINDSLDFLRLDVGDNAVCGKEFLDNKSLKCDWELEIHIDKKNKYYSWYLEQEEIIKELKGKIENETL